MSFHISPNEPVYPTKRSTVGFKQTIRGESNLSVGSDPKATRRSLTGVAEVLCGSGLGSVEEVLGPGLEPPPDTQ